MHINEASCVGESLPVTLRDGTRCGTRLSPQAVGGSGGWVLYEPMLRKRQNSRIERKKTSWNILIRVCVIQAASRWTVSASGKVWTSDERSAAFDVLSKTNYCIQT